MERTDELKERIRQQPLNDRLEESRRRIGDMCSQGRCPKMTIPVQHDDDDFYINTTLADAQAIIAALQAQLTQLDRTVADVYAQRDGLQKDLAQRTAELEEAKREVDVWKEKAELRGKEACAQRAELERVRAERDRLALCGHDHSTQWWQVRYEDLASLVAALPKEPYSLEFARHTSFYEPLQALTQHRQGMEGVNES